VDWRHIPRANPASVKKTWIVIRQLLFEGKYAEVKNWPRKKSWANESKRDYYYQTLGDVFFHFEGVENISVIKEASIYGPQLRPLNLNPTAVQYKT
jgi:hypothetical protein